MPALLTNAGESFLSLLTYCQKFFFVHAVLSFEIVIILIMRQFLLMKVSLLNEILLKY